MKNLLTRALFARKLAYSCPALVIAASAASTARRGLDWLSYYNVGFAASLPIVCISSDDWGDALCPRETADDLRALGGTLRGFRDRFGNNPVVTIYMNSAKPDFERIAASRYRSYSFRFRYDDDPEMVAAYKELIRAGLADIQFHGREHYNIPLWLHALRNDAPGFRGLFRRKLMPYVDSDAYLSQKARDPRYEYLFRSFVDASVLPVRSLPAATQHEMASSGLSLIEANFGMRPRLAVPSGHVWDVNTWQALRANGIRYLELPVMPITGVGPGQALVKTGKTIQWFSSINGLQTIIRNCTYEPGWKASSRSHALAEARRAARRAESLLALGIPVIIGTHSVHYTGDPSKRDANLAGLAALLGDIQRKFPDVAFLSAADLAEYMHGQPAATTRKVPFAIERLTSPRRAWRVMCGVWSHPGFRILGVAAASAALWAAAATVVPARRHPGGRPRRRCQARPAAVRTP